MALGEAFLLASSDSVRATLSGGFGLTVVRIATLRHWALLFRIQSVNLFSTIQNGQKKGGGPLTAKFVVSYNLRLDYPIRMKRSESEQ